MLEIINAEKEMKSFSDGLIRRLNLVEKNPTTTITPEHPRTVA